MSKESTRRWTTAAEFARLTGISQQTLANWRYQDRLAGREGPAPGYPLYRYFGGAVRYYLDPELLYPTGCQPLQRESVAPGSGVRNQNADREASVEGCEADSHQGSQGGRHGWR